MDKTTAKFDYLASSWKSNVSHFSLTVQIIRHESYRELLEMGSVIIPMVLKKLKDDDYWIGWSCLLSELTGVVPSYEPKISDGVTKLDVKALGNSWIQWGKHNGYIN